MNEKLAIPRQKALRIAILDDVEHVQEVYRMLLPDWFKDVELISFQNGDAAFQALSELEPDLLITDWNHPGMNGGDLIRALAKKGVKYPVLAISASYSHDSSYLEVGELGVKVVFMYKPYDPVALWETLNELVGPCDFPW